MKHIYVISIVQLWSNFCHNQSNAIACAAAQHNVDIIPDEDVDCNDNYLGKLALFVLYIVLKTSRHLYKIIIET